ncbi:DciA family protein [Luteimonas abyssi]|uniref:DciA family protein n=1 Tax=Luteimonas abyssi TaxID=1247514 RepID=UPI0012FC90C9
MSGKRSKPPVPSGPRPAQPAVDAAMDGASGGPLRRALWLDGLDRRLRPLLPSPLPAHARLGNVDGHRLVLLVDAAVWHAKVRLAGPQILESARSLGLEVTELTVRTSTRPAHAPPPASPAPRVLSTRAQAALREAAALLPPPKKAGTGRSP